MKKMRKLVPAFAMLMVAAIMMSTASFAWFSMNTEVTATGMQVVAKSDNAYLLISATGTTASAIQGENVITVPLTVSDENAKVYPSAPVLTSTEAGYAGGTIVDASNVNNVANWYTANATAPNVPDIKVSTAKALTDFSGYVIKKTVYLTVAAGSNGVKDLNVTATFAQKDAGTDLAAAKVIVATDDGGFAVLSSGSATGDISGTNTVITDSTVRKVDIYIYYDGNVSQVYTNNIANLTGATINLAFNGNAVPST